MHVGRDVEHADMGEAQLFECAISRPDVRTFDHRTAAAIDNDIDVLGKLCHSLLKGLDALRFGVA